MYKVRMVDENIMELESIHIGGGKHGRTKIDFFYTDIEHWVDMSYGDARKRTDFTKKLWHNKQLCEKAIEWSKKYYLPKIKEDNFFVWKYI